MTLHYLTGSSYNSVTLHSISQGWTQGATVLQCNITENLAEVEVVIQLKGDKAWHFSGSQKF